MDDPAEQLMESVVKSYGREYEEKEAPIQQVHPRNAGDVEF
jgi:hypothetical protein